MMQAMVLAAGMGTRLRPLTDSMPKALVPVGGEALLSIQIRKLRAAGFDSVVVNVHHFAGMVKQFLQSHDFGLSVAVSDERQLLLNTGGAIKHAASKFLSTENPVLIHNVDILSNADLWGLYETGRQHDAVMLVSNRPTSRYLLFDEKTKLVGWTNIQTGEVKSPHPGLDLSACHRYAFAGIHVFSPQLLSYMQSWPASFSIIDFYLSICDKADVIGHFDSALRLLDVGKQDTLAAAAQFQQALSAEENAKRQ